MDISFNIYMKATLEAKTRHEKETLESIGIAWFREILLLYLIERLDSFSLQVIDKVLAIALQIVVNKFHFADTSQSLSTMAA